MTQTWLKCFQQNHTRHHQMTKSKQKPANAANARPSCKRRRCICQCSCAGWPEMPQSLQQQQWLLQTFFISATYHSVCDMTMWGRCNNHKLTHPHIHTCTLFDETMKLKPQLNHFKNRNYMHNKQFTSAGRFGDLDEFEQKNEKNEKRKMPKEIWVWFFKEFEWGFLLKSVKIEVEIWNMVSDSRNRSDQQKVKKWTDEGRA